MGGLGNILFPLAYCYNLSIERGLELVINYNHIGYVHTRAERYKDGILKTFKTIETEDLASFHTIKESDFVFSNNLLPVGKNIFLHGYFQSEKYFKANEEKVRSLVISDELNYKKAKKRYSEFVKQNQETVSIHVRRGNYLTLKDYHANLAPDYYYRGIEKINPKKVLVFSDDLNFCRETFSGPEFIFVHPEKDIQDMYLMSMCDNNIIANSTFSWWGAWLNQNPEKKVIAPKEWFGPKNASMETCDIIPEQWIRT